MPKEDDCHSQGSGPLLSRCPAALRRSLDDHLLSRFMAHRDPKPEANGVRSPSTTPLGFQVVGKGAPGKQQGKVLVLPPADIHLPEFAGSAPRAWVQVTARCQKAVELAGQRLRGGVTS